MKTKNLVKFNIWLFTLYLVIFFIVKITDFGLFFYLKAALGIAVFFITGFDCAIVVKKILKLELDLSETLLVGVIISLFFVPLAIFLVYQIAGSVSEWLNLSMFFIISLFSLIFVKYAERKI